jgi:hypothetical protein
VIAIHASLRLLRREDDPYTSISELIREDIRDHRLRKKRFARTHNLLDFIFCKTVFFGDHGENQNISQKQEVRGSEDFSKGVYYTVNNREKSETDDEIRRFSEILSTKTLCNTRKRNDTSISTCDVMVLTLSAHVLKTVWIADREDMSTFTATSLKHFLSIYRRLSSEKSVDTETFSFLEFCKHSKIERFLK